MVTPTACAEPARQCLKQNQYVPVASAINAKNATGSRVKPINISDGGDVVGGELRHSTGSAGRRRLSQGSVTA